MEFLDSHCHIHSQDYGLPTAEVLARARLAGVNQIICVGTDVPDSQLALDFARHRLGVWASVAIHPHQAADALALPALRKLALSEHQAGKLVAIGECGLDYYYDHSSPAEQEVALRYQLALALELDLPVIFHVRDAFDDFWPIFNDYPGVRGVLHSFTDSPENCAIALAKGLFIGVNGIMTFTKNQWQLDLLKTVPLQKLLLETDAPFLTPVPYRGKVNEPAYVTCVAGMIAQLRGQDLSDIVHQTTKNAQKLFNLQNKTEKIAN